MSKKMTKAQEAEREEALAKLRKLLKPGDTVYTKLNHVSRSGMSGSITPFIIRDGEPYYIAWSVAIIFRQKRDKYDGITMGGCGMDMGFDLVYNLGYYLWPNGTPKPHSTRNGEADSSGGYALQQRWI